MRVEITPKFSVKQIIDETIRKDWFEFQARAFALGANLTKYMQNYINTRRRRRGGTGNLANSITFEATAGAGLGRVAWGIGNITLLNRVAKYWYVINYGKMVGGQPFVPARGKFVPGSFEGNPPAYIGFRAGTEKFNYKSGSKMGMYPKSPVRPINYIQASRARFNRDLHTLILKIRKGL